MEILTRTSTRHRLRPSDRFFISILTDLYDAWKETLLIVKPETVIRWHQQAFKLFWRWKSRSALGRPKIPQAQINAQRTHLGINKDSPEARDVQAEGEIDKIAVGSGLHDYYFRKAA